MGGYFYDYPEILFMAGALWLVTSGSFWPLVPLTALATVNKEAFLFFVPALYPFIRVRASRIEAITQVGILLLTAGATYLVIRNAYLANPGWAAQNHSPEALAYYLNPMNLLRRETTYGLRVFQAYSFVTLGLVGLVAFRGWRGQSAAVRDHIRLAAAINVPLFLLLCFPGEVRNLSLLYMGFLFLLCENFAILDRDRTGQR